VTATAAYPVVRLAMALPAIAARHEVTPKRIWNLSQGSGFKLLVLLVIIPGTINGITILAFDAEINPAWTAPVAGILETYFALFYLSLLALSYGALSGRQEFTRPGLKTVSNKILGSRFLWPSVLLIVAGVGLASVLDAVYKLGPGQTVIISRFGKPDRVKSGSELGIKLPFIEQTKPVSEKEMHEIDGSGRFYAITKDTISIKYDARWHVINPDRYMQTTAAQAHHVNRRLEHLLNSNLRNHISRLKPSELNTMMENNTNKFSLGDESGNETRLDAVLGEINSKLQELGIEMTNWRFEIDPSQTSSK